MSSHLPWLPAALMEEASFRQPPTYHVKGAILRFSTSLACHHI